MFTKGFAASGNTAETTALEVDFLIVAGGGAGGHRIIPSGIQSYQANGGGGGAGTMRYHQSVTLSGSSLTITVGAGGSGYQAGQAVIGDNGGNSSVVSNDNSINLSAAGGGAGGCGNQSHYGTYGDIPPADTGGGGGCRQGTSNVPTGGAATTYVGAGGNGDYNWSGGGGGNGGDGYNADDGTYPCQGGIGVQNSITGTATYYGGGGSGSRYVGSVNVGVQPGGGGNGAGRRGSTIAAVDGTGGGGGGLDPDSNGDNDGANGVVIMRILTSAYSGTTTGSPTVTTDGSYTVVKWLSSGAYTI